jgi:peptide/nickel transport system substrate-binding protein
VIVAALAALVAACGGGSGKQATGTTIPSTSSTLGGEETTSTAAPSDGATSTTVASAAPVPSRSTSASTTRTTKKTTATTASGAVIAGPRGGITNATAPPSTAPRQDIQSGGTVTFLKVAEIPSLDPITMNNSGGNDAPPASALFDMLVYTDPSNGSVVPQTAESLTSSDALVWTLRLRPNIKFTDGTPYDAAAVKFNWQRLQDPSNAAVRASQANLVQSMDVVDSTTLRFTLKSKNAVFPVAVALIPFVGSPTAIQQMGDSFGSHPIGAGPFIFKSWTRDSEMVLTRNPNYWNAPRPYIDQLVLRVIGDEVQRINTFAAGQGNMVFVGVAANAANAVKSNIGTNNPMVLNGGIIIYFNTKKLPFSDVRARQAFAMAIDFTDYNKVVDSGLLEPIDSVFRHDSPFYDPATIYPPYNQAKAQQLFNAYAADHGPLNFTMTYAPSQIYVLSTGYLQGVLNKYSNVNMSLKTEASALHVANCTSLNYDSACMSGNIFDDPEPTWTGLFTCNASPSATGWCNTQFDKDVADNQAALDPKTRIAAMKDAQKQFYAEMPALYLERRYSWTFSNPNVQDFKFVNDGLVLFDRVWLKTR